MQKPAKKYYSHQEYLELEEASEYKNEYYKGEIFALAGGSSNHNRIIRNLSSELHFALKNTQCEIFINEIRVWIETRDLFSYPDIAVVCNNVEYYPDRNDTIINPLIIVEVLSESTENYDRGNKFLFYRDLPTFQEYILIDQKSYHIEQFYIGSEGKWQLTEYNDVNEILKFSKIKVEIPLKDIFYLVKFV